MNRTVTKDNYGFTLAEMLIVIAIVSVLAGVGFSAYSNSLEKAKQAVDLTNMREAYSEAMYRWMTSGDSPDTIYYYDGNDVVKDNDGIVGYGKSTKNVNTFSDGLPFKASGIPCRKSHPSYLIIKMNESGVERITWGGAYSGENVTSQEEYNQLSKDEKLRKDLLLVDSLQELFRSMTYGDLKKLFFNDDGSIKGGMADGTIDNFLCITIAYSTISNDGKVVTGDTKNNIYLKQMFENTGFDTDLEDNETYIINSVQERTNTIWLNLRIKKSVMKNLDANSPEWNQNASKAYTYVKSGGAVTPDPLREAIRKNS